MNTKTTTSNCIPLRVIGLLGIILATSASAVLVASALGFSESLPGCGPESGCARITSSPWGRLPLIGLPLSFIGLAYFGGLLVPWAMAPPTPGLVRVIRLGMLVSLGLVIVMLVEGALCQWCLATHFGNLVTWVMAELLLRRNEQERVAGVGWLATGFIVIGLALLVTNSIRSEAIEKRNAERLAANVETIREGTRDEGTLALLESGHRRGPDDAAVQVVMFTDYQCPDCRLLEGQLSRILTRRTDTSLAIRHFPFCAACNEHTGGRTMHPNACWAARASEAAGILGGEEGFWRMHEWLFQEKGRFTDASFPESLRALGFDPEAFIPIMTSQQTLDTVRRDTDAARELGIFFTPMIFINGVEYTWYYGGQDSLEETIDLVARSGREVIAPLPARERPFEDWRRGKPLKFPGVVTATWKGDGDIRILIYGDYQHESSRKLDRIIRSLQERGDPVSYAWRHYPLESVPGTSQQFQGSDEMARAVEAVGNLAGDDARWSIHDWFIDGSPPTDTQAMTMEVARRTGLDHESLLSEMQGPAVSSQIARDMNDKRNSWKTHVPVLVIDERLVTRWGNDQTTPEELIDRIIESCRTEQDG